MSHEEVEGATILEYVEHRLLCTYNYHIVETFCKYYCVERLIRVRICDYYGTRFLLICKPSSHRSGWLRRGVDLSACISQQHDHEYH